MTKNVLIISFDYTYKSKRKIIPANELKHSSTSISISCVIYDTPLSILKTTLISLAQALNYAKENKIIVSSELHIINNNPAAEAFFFKILDLVKADFEKIISYNGNGNIGYGRANNLAIYNTHSTYHLILNPDVKIAIGAIALGINYLKENQKVGLVAPSATNERGEPEYLAKRMPTPFIILLRGINNKYLNRLFNKKMDWYIYKEKMPAKNAIEIELASGCFMLCKTDILQNIRGFSEKYFLYFEDFDLSRKIGRIARLMYLPEMEIIHCGGHTAKKGIKYKYYFIKASFIFFWSNDLS